MIREVFVGRHISVATRIRGVTPRGDICSIEMPYFNKSMDEVCWMIIGREQVCLRMHPLIILKLGNLGFTHFDT